MCHHPPDQINGPHLISHIIAADPVHLLSPEINLAARRHTPRTTPTGRKNEAGQQANRQRRHLLAGRLGVIGERGRARPRVEGSGYIWSSVSTATRAARPATTTWSQRARARPSPARSSSGPPTTSSLSGPDLDQTTTATGTASVQSGARSISYPGRWPQVAPGPRRHRLGRGFF